MDKALLLLNLQKAVLQSSSFDEAVFIILNKTHMLVPYDQAVFFEIINGKLSAKSVSGNAVIDPKTPLTNIISAYLDAHKPEGDDKLAPHLIKDVPENHKAQWDKIKHPHNALAQFVTEQEGSIGCVLIQRSTPFDESEMAILDELSQSYTQALALHKLRKKPSALMTFSLNSKTKKVLFIAAIILFFFPVRLSITAPAEIVAENSKTINAPFDGVLEEILIKPGDDVLEGAIIARMDKDTLQSQEQSAKQALDLAQISLSRARRESLADPEKKSEISRLQAEIKTREIEYNYANTLLARSEIKAPQAGIAIFSDVNTLRGKPFSTGEAIMRIADTATQELLIRVPADAMIAIDKSAGLSFHSNVNPLSNYEGEITSLGYQASQDADGLLTYKLRGSLKNNSDGRIGWKGNARIYGSWSILGYSILRRPLVAFRNITGI